MTPVDLVPKLSQVACVIQCGGIWIGGKGWGLTWKLVQSVVKVRNVESVYGKCHINLSDEDRGLIDRQEIHDGDDVDEDTPTVFSKTKDTVAEDSDEEEEEEETPPPAPVKKAKKVVKKAVEEEVEAVAEKPKKKVVKKKVVAAEA